MDRQMASAGGALEQLGQLGLSEMDLLKLAASGALGQHGYNTRSHSAEMASSMHQAGAVHQPTFSPSWPPAYGAGGGDRDAAAAAAIAVAHGGQPPMGPGAAYYPGAGMGVGGGLAQGPLGGGADLSYLAQLGAGTASAALVAAGASSAAFGEGPRIYVGGVPDLVTVAMVRDHFSRWGVVRDVHFPKERTSRRRRHFCFVTFESMQAAERAVAESNREIGGYPVAAINIPTDRLTHYGLRQTSALASPTAALRAGLPFGSGSPGGGLPSGLGSLGAPPMGPGEAYASPTRTQSHSGIYSNVAHQVGAHRIRGTTSADFLTHQSVPDVPPAAQLGGSHEHDLAAALATLRFTQQQQAAMAAAANGYGSTPGSGSSTRQPSHDFSVSRSSQEYPGQPGAGMGGGSLPQGGQPGAAAVNPAAGGDIYTVLANMQRNSLSAQQQQQQRGSPQPASHMSLLHGGSVSAGGTPLGTPPGEGFHAMSMPRPGSAHESQQTLAASQPQQPGLNTVHSYSFLSQGQQPQPQQNSLLHHRSSSFSGATASGGGPGGLPHHPDFQSTRSHSAAMARSASPLARISTGAVTSSPQPRSLSALNTDSPATKTSGSNRSSGEPIPAGLLQGGLLPQGGALPHNYSGSLHEQYLATLQASLPAALGQSAGLGQNHGGQLHSSLLTMSAPSHGLMAAAAAASAAPDNALHGRRHSLDDSRGEAGAAGSYNSGQPASHLRGGGGNGGSTGGAPAGQHPSASTADLVNSFANARPRSAQPDASQELRTSVPQQQAPPAQQQPQLSAPQAAAGQAHQNPGQELPNPGYGDKHGPPLESKQDTQESGGTDDSATLDAKMRDSVADLLRGSSGSLSHSLSQQQHQQAQQYEQHQQPQEQRQGDWRHSWDAGRSDSGRGIQQFHHHTSGSLPRTAGSWNSSEASPFHSGYKHDVVVSTRGA